MMSRLVKNETPYFLWTIKRDAIDYHSLSCDQMLNHYGKTMSFTTKIGLCVNMRTLPWFVQANPDSFFPRCYSLCTEGEKQAFLDDFRRTVASSILKWVVSHQQDDRSKSRSQKEDAMPGHLGNQKDPQGTDGKLQDLPEWLLDVACRVCQAYLGQLEHEDIDVDEHDTKDLSEAEWEDLMQQYYALVQGNAFISSSGNYFSQCQDLLNQIAAVNPQTEIDGLRNIWIVKPGAKSRGRDIVCMDRVEDILELVATERPPSRDNRWVVQKYIETPMLIYDTKFDIRQWFLVTDWNPLTIWFYKESYLRFSTQRFSLDSLDSAIHLCNNSIQKHLKNDVGRSPLLPACNMWSSAQFREHLQRQGLGTVWGSLIYPSMKRAIANTMKVAQSHVEPRRNSFELYGADFILGSDFRPWLIEINSSPTMHPSTPVTAELCTRVQEDTIKVVVDRRLDRNCDTGNFELLWRQPAVELPPFSGSDLCVEGISVKRAKKLVVPTPTLSLAAPLSDVYKLKSRYSAARRDPVGRLLRAALQPSGTGQDTKVPVLPRTASPWRPELPAYYSHHANVTALKGTLTRSQATRHVAPNLTGRHRLVPMSQDRKTLPPASVSFPWDSDGQFTDPSDLRGVLRRTGVPTVLPHQEDPSSISPSAWTLAHLVPFPGLFIAQFAVSCAALQALSLLLCCSPAGHLLSAPRDPVTGRRMPQRAQVALLSVKSMNKVVALLPDAYPQRFAVFSL
ncbi:protein monoglycylase TTLL8 [Ctenodactylus gundi]